MLAAVAKRHVNRVGDLESLFLNLEELVLANSGEDEFEEIFKLLIAKLVDEAGQERRFRPYNDRNRTFSEICSLLREAEKTWPGILGPTPSPRLTPEHLEVCVNALASHSIAEQSLQVMDSFFEFLVAKSAKGAKGQYFTPRYVVEFCVRVLKPTPLETVLDPACGSGGFLIQTLNFVREASKLTPSDVKDYCSSKLWGMDMDPRAVRIAQALLILAGSSKANVYRLNSLLRDDPHPALPFLLSSDKSMAHPLLTIEDVCRSRLRHHKGFDLILTNPPFAGEVQEKQILDRYCLSQGKKRIERDLLFLERCIQLLKPGGRLAIVLPHNIFGAESSSRAREWLLQHARVLAVVGLGRNTFLPHTHQKASILFAEKRQDQKRTYDEKVFFAVSERDGKNSKGQLIFRSGTNENASAWNRVEHDLDQIAKEMSPFLRKTCASRLAAAS